MKIGFAGLGQMGRPIALNLAKSGAPLLTAARNPDRFIELREHGISLTDEMAELAACDVIFLCLPDGDAVFESLFGASRLANRLGPGQIVVDLGTSDYDKTLEIARRIEEAGAAFLDSPVSGMQARAASGTLTVMCGGAVATFEAVRPLLGHIGNKILHLGPVGSGQLAKLMNQLLFDINVAALAEILPLSVKLGLDPDQLGDIVNSGTGRSHASEFFVPKILKGRFSEGYPLQAAYKDIVGGMALSANLRVPMPVLAAAATTYQTALLQGYGDQDKGAMIRVFEELLTARFRSQAEGEEQS